MVKYELTVKWGKEKFPKVELDTTEQPEIFRAQLFALTNVPPDRQKIMMKGSTLKDSWAGFESKLKNGATILLMGSADPLPEAPKEEIKFLEDMTEAEQNKVMKMPPGLVNLGNTCYLNSVLQCLRTIPELTESLKSMDEQNTEPLLLSLSALWRQMDESGEAATPFLFLSMIHQTFPQFAERDDKGKLRQQDANEAWLAIVRYLQLLKGQEGSTKDIVSQIMGIKIKRSTKCIEEGGETEEKVEHDDEISLSCFIDQNVKYCMTGIQNRLKEEIEKRSEKLERNAKHLQTSTVTRLPQYVAINFIRFYYKQDKNVSAKILKDVKYPEELDLYDICDTELKEKLRPQREKLKEIADKEMEIMAKKKRNNVKVIEKPKYTQFENNYFENDIGSNSTGWYTLKAVLTHQGRSSDAGHYIGWSRNEDKWVKFDDDKTSSHSLEDILNLSGGGDWHTAYICLYEAKKLPIFTPDLDDSEAMETS